MPVVCKNVLLVYIEKHIIEDCFCRSLTARCDCCMGAFEKYTWYAPYSIIFFPVWQHTFVSPSPFSRRAVISYWRKYVHEVLVNRLGGLSLPRKSVVRLTDRPDMTLDVYRGRKTTMQQLFFSKSTNRKNNKLKL